MNNALRKVSLYASCLSLIGALYGCAGDPLQSGLDPFAPMVFKEGVTTMPLNPPTGIACSLLCFSAHYF